MVGGAGRQTSAWACPPSRSRARAACSETSGQSMTSLCVIPTFNEAQTIERVAQALPGQQPRCSTRAFTRAPHS